MIKHVVMWSFKAEAEGADKKTNIAWIKQSLLALQPEIPEILSMEIGEDIGVGRDPWDMVLITTFANAETLDYYQNHPKHKVISNFVGKVRENRASVDFTIPDQPVQAAR